MNQTLPVIYQNEHFMVDPSYLFNESQKFRDLINERGQNIQNISLRINYNCFTAKNVANFLKICEKKQTDVQNSELTEICLIAKMFQADQIMNTALTFIINNIDSNFSIPYYQFEENNGNNYLTIEDDGSETPQVIHPDLNELEFDESQEKIQVEDNKDNNKVDKPKKKLHSVFYQIKYDNQIMKLPRFYFLKDDNIIYMAKIKNNEIYIGAGKNFHISENKFENTARITRDSKDYNTINTDDQEFKIRFVRYFEKYSQNVSFTHKGNKFNWRPRQPKSLHSFSGEFNHQPIQSKKNMILQNARNHPTYILRKMSKKTYECECHPAVNPIIAFSIALSQITGPIST